MKSSGFSSKILSSLLVVSYLFLYLFSFNLSLNKYKFNYSTFIIGYEAANNFGDSISGVETESNDIIDAEFPVIQSSLPLMFIIYFKKIIYEFLSYPYRVVYQNFYGNIFFSLSTFFLENLEKLLTIEYILINQKGRDSPYIAHSLS